MDRRMVARLAVVPLMGGAALVGLAAPAVAAAPTPVARAAAGPANELYVSQKYCSATADGSEDAPFCTISAAAAVVQPGQTVLVQPGNYPENVTFTRSGTETAPITFRAVNAFSGWVYVGRTNGSNVTGTILSLSQVHDVVVDGFVVQGQSASASPAVVIDGSSRVTLNGIAAQQTKVPAAVRVGGASRDVTISRNWLVNINDTGNAALVVEGAATGTTVVANQVVAGRIGITDAPGSTVTNNTVTAACGPGIDVAGASPDAVIENNIVKPLSKQTALCSVPVTDAAVSVSSASLPSVADYNLIDPTAGVAPYAWAGTTHATIEAFHAATGQGGHDISADPQLDVQRGGMRSYLPLKPGSPAIDSGNASARGVPATDMVGNSHLDDPQVTNTGTGNGFHDRGAVERVGGFVWSVAPFRQTRGGGPLDGTARSTSRSTWPSDGPVGTFTYKFSDSRFYRVSQSAEETHRFRRAGRACAYIRANVSGNREEVGSYTTLCTVLGAHYTPVSPTRLLDTRNAVGVGTRTPIPANSDVVLPLSDIGGVPVARISAVVLNVTVTEPTTSGFLTVYPDGTGTPSASNVNFVARETVPNLVTVPVENGKIRIRNSSGGTVHVIADLQGQYSAEGQGFTALNPQRALDTRTSGGALSPNTTRQLDLGRQLPADATAVVLNVTVTAPTTSGVLKVFPAGAPVPAASNLNFVAGQSIPNLVTVPVVGGKVDIHNASSGSTHVIADVAGYFGPDGELTYVPNSPVRIADTRADASRGNHPLNPRESINVWADFAAGANCSCPGVTALVANLTVTAPTTAGVLTAYPTDQARPSASNVNFVAGETASNLAIVGTAGGTTLYNNSSGTTHAIVDQAGVFITPLY
ncbi:right-handed parallel beta-helix repeat-containing protein [Micromonospora sp. WMMD1120]|uniref:right-handed parallel beta-helix repeat-containing protein n=1 Tax=Micromonospora sp. WMMD1120 TaxID=3016106 RepID=UPI0024163E56|nr:right-handed parallel beta-helix repeat-containing protein [Micromonospora sp. WMMD1120]MDG4806689.1 right-handed parallel beta-helix repeat-containing protein [Micromonospora sp. WMMD1120]